MGYAWEWSLPPEGPATRHLEIAVARGAHGWPSTEEGRGSAARHLEIVVAMDVRMGCAWEWSLPPEGWPANRRGRGSAERHLEIVVARGAHGRPALPAT
mgnify:CR=1 FL=1